MVRSDCLSIHSIIHEWSFLPRHRAWIVFPLATLPLLMARNVFFAIIHWVEVVAVCGAISPIVYHRHAYTSAHIQCLVLEASALEAHRVRLRYLLPLAQHEMVLYNANDVFSLCQRKHEMEASILTLHHECYTVDSPMLCFLLSNSLLSPLLMMFHHFHTSCVILRNLCT